MEAEYQALGATIQELIWIRGLLKEIGFSQNNPTLIHEDNQACISFATKQVFHGRAKHVELKFHFIREVIQSKQCIISYCPSPEMIADIFTKPLGKVLHNQHTQSLQLEQVSVMGSVEGI